MSLVICEAVKACKWADTCVSHGRSHKPMADCEPMECAGQPGGEWRTGQWRRKRIRCVPVKGE